MAALVAAVVNNRFTLVVHLILGQLPSPVDRLYGNAVIVYGSRLADLDE